MVAGQVTLLAAVLLAPSAVTAATLDFTLQSPSVSTLAYSDLVTFRGTYTCLNDAVSVCPTTAQSNTATFALRPSGGSTFTPLTTVSTGYVFTVNPAGCETTCSVPFAVTWKAGKVGATTIPPGVYDVGLTTTIGAGQPVLTGGLTIVAEDTTTTYAGATAGLGGTPFALQAAVVDLDRGLSAGSGIFSPDVNLAGAGLVTFALYDSTNTNLVVGPVSANLTGGGAVSGSPTLTPPSSGGTFRMRTTFLGNSFYTTSSDLDVITVAPSNTPPELVLPAGPVAEATSAAGAAITFSVAAVDAEDEPDPTPTCDHASGSTFGLGDTTVDCSVTDTGGLSASGSFVVRVLDTTDPSVAVSTAESAAGTGWYSIASNDGSPGVTVDVTAADLVGVAGLSCTDNGVDVGALDPDGDSFVLGDGQHVVDCVATDGSGNDDSASASFDVDQAAPSISSSVAPGASSTGWWNAFTGAPTASFSCSDGGSGLASCSGPFDFGEGADQSTTGSAADVAGNTAATDVTGIDVDLTAPTAIAFVGGGLADGGSYPDLYVPDGPTGCTATDPVSGLGSCVVVGYSTAVGPHVLTATATDAAGNSTTGTMSYEVLPWTLVGFAKPIEMTGFNALKAGNQQLLKFEIFAGTIEVTSPDAVVALEQQEISCATSLAAGPSSLAAGPSSPAPKKKPGPNVDAAGGHLSVRWESPDAPGTCWRVTLRTADGSSLSALFKLR